VLHPIQTTAGNSLQQFLGRLSREESGQDLIEYALLASMVALGSVASTTSLATAIANDLNGVATSLTNSITPPDNDPGHGHGHGHG
jgi:pilus assembly protein Flp/PilA